MREVRMRLRDFGNEWNALSSPGASCPRLSRASTPRRSANFGQMVNDVDGRDIGERSDAV